MAERAKKGGREARGEERERERKEQKGYLLLLVRPPAILSLGSRRPDASRSRGSFGEDEPTDEDDVLAVQWGEFRFQRPIALARCRSRIWRGWGREGSSHSFYAGFFLRVVMDGSWSRTAK